MELSESGKRKLTENIGVIAGLFTVYGLDFGPGAFNGQPRFVEVRVRCPTGSGQFTKLDPRQELAPSPYALAIPGLWSWYAHSSYNLIGGADGNSIDSIVRGGTISCGGTDHLPSHITDDYGTIGGGEGNVAGMRMISMIMPNTPLLLGDWSTGQPIETVPSGVVPTTRLMGKPAPSVGAGTMSRKASLPRLVAVMVIKPRENTILPLLAGQRIRQQEQMLPLAAGPKIMLWTGQLPLLAVIATRP